MEVKNDRLKAEMENTMLALSISLQQETDFSYKSQHDTKIRQYPNSCRFALLP